MKPPTINEIFKDRDRMLNAVREGARDAVIMHKRLGNPIADFRDGKVVIVQPEDIEVPPPVEQPNPDSNAA